MQRMYTWFQDLKLYASLGYPGRTSRMAADQGSCLSSAKLPGRMRRKPKLAVQRRKRSKRKRRHPSTLGRGKAAIRMEVTMGRLMMMRNWMDSLFRTMKASTYRRDQNDRAHSKQLWILILMISLIKTGHTR